MQAFVLLHFGDLEQQRFCLNTKRTIFSLLFAVAVVFLHLHKVGVMSCLSEGQQTACKT